MSKKVEVTELVIDYVDDNKRLIAKQEHIFVGREDFIHSVLKHGKLCDERTIGSKWKKIIADGAVETLKDGKNILRVSDIKRVYPEIYGKIMIILIEGDELNIGAAGIRRTEKPGVCESERDVCVRCVSEMCE